MFHRKNKKQTSETKNSNDRVSMYWFLLIVVFGICTILTILSSIYVFRQIDKGEFSLGEKGAKAFTQVLDVEKLQKLVDTLQVRAGDYERIRTSAPTAIDPSR